VVIADGDLDEEVAGRATQPAGRAAALQPDLLAGRNAGRNPRLDVARTLAAVEMDRRLDAVDRVLEVEGEIGLDIGASLGSLLGTCGTRAECHRHDRRNRRADR
jgi:hypothetical protein